jgi:hypothetical protein
VLLAGLSIQAQLAAAAGCLYRDEYKGMLAPIQSYAATLYSLKLPVGTLESCYEKSGERASTLKARRDVY